MDVKERVIAGGRGLALRYVLGFGLSLLNAFVVTKLIGSANYGLFAGSLALFGYCWTVAQLGLMAYLVRRPNAPDADDYHQAFTILAASGLVIAALTLFATAYLERLIATLPQFGSVFWVMQVILPLSLVAQVPLAQLERSLRYPVIARIDVAGQAVGVAVSLPLAGAGAGVWAPVAGWAIQQVLLALLYFRVSAYRPKLRMEATRAGAMLKYGLGFSAAAWVYQLRSLVNPLVVGPFLGASAMGVVGLATRVAEVLSFTRQIAWRLSLSAFAHVGQDRKRLLHWVEFGMQTQAPLVGVPLVALAFVFPMVVQRIFGNSWEGLSELYPFVACAFLINAMFAIQSSALHVLGYNLDAARFPVLYVATLFVATVFLAPRLGVVGYGWAEIVALPAYVVLHLSIVKRFGQRPSYIGLFWAVAFALLLFWKDLGWLSAVGVAAAGLSSDSRAAARSLWDRLQGARYGARKS